MTFSRRSGFDTTPNALAEARARLGVTDDLSVSNPSRCGLEQPALVALLGGESGAAYEPDAMGLDVARVAVSRHYAERDAVVAPEHIVLTASTSEGYGFLFKLLCDPGDRVLAPSPSYPLFPYLAGLDGVLLQPYPLAREEHWRPDVAAIERLVIAERPKALLLVHPGNPTGRLIRHDDAAALVALCRAHDMALIADEVFADYATHPLGRRTFAGENAALTFVLSGLSKVALLPQLKLGWIAVSGPDAQVAEALGRLELIADTYLSVATPVQLALPQILAATNALQASLRARLASNLATLDAALAPWPALGRQPHDGGWYAIVELPRTRDDDAWCLALLERARVSVQPGYFYELPRGTMVVSLLPEPDHFAAMIARAVAVWSEP